MTIFHVLQYPITDVEDQEELDPLPIEVVAKWRRRVEDFAIESATSVVHLDKTGKVQKAIDAIYLYRDGKISRDRLRSYSNSMTHAATYAVYTTSANYAAYYAANSLSEVAYYAANSLSEVAWHKSRQESLELFKKWLIEELYNYEMDVECTITIT